MRNGLFAAVLTLMIVSPSLVRAQTAAGTADINTSLQMPVNLADMPEQVRSIYSYLLVIDEYSRVARDPAAAAIAAVMTAADLLKSQPQGPQAAIDYFTPLLQRSSNEAVRRVIQLQLADLYKQMNQPDKALDQLRTVISETGGQ